MDKNHFDVIVVGFGLSGLAVTKRLEEQNKKVLVISGQFPTASQVAGGICNPVVLKKFNLAWNSEELYKNAVPFYKGFQQQFQENFYIEKPILKIFNSIKEQNDWFSALGKPILDNFLVEDLMVNKNISLNVPHKIGSTKHTGLLYVSSLLNSYKKYLIKMDRFLEEDFAFTDLNVDSESVRYKNYSADNIIFCEGTYVNQNPYFNYLPIEGNKGEYITIKAPNLKLDDIVKGSFFMIPKGNDTYKVGATYSRDFKGIDSTNSAKNQLIEKVKQMINCDFEVIDQEAGIRPTVTDRKPIIGQHPKYANVYISNGFGSRGILFAPTVSKQLVEAIYSGKEIPKEINVSRFYKDFDEAPFL
jgi:glycine oxidase